MEYYGAATTPTDDFLAHFGVKGMKWGIRKAVQRNGTGRPHSSAYNKAQEKLSRIASAGGAIGGIAGGLTGGFAGGAIGAAGGALATGLGYYATHRKQFRQGGQKKSQHDSRSVSSRNKYKSNRSAKLSAKDRRFLDGMHGATRKGATIGALTAGGGVGGGAVSIGKYIKQHPKEYAQFKKKYKQMSFKDRMKVSYGYY